ncbi:hypothetical protein IWW38_003454 [Coemansia aciculifera]|uniref:Uncharacterized protein n=1 Tax=Coemansia aciculifera TaxID=417176 RepID=A0ACC1M2B2_9FUNG|nr:hypothetical protein IWW38_003454 [Coemansia aciculifera]
MGRSEERIFVVGLYIYEMENIVSAKLKLRDPIVSSTFESDEERHAFCQEHYVVDEEHSVPTFVQEFEGIEIKRGRYICYPNLYQVKMPSFTLADPTKPGSVKCIAFYIVDPSTKLMSTSLVKPQDPSWAGSNSDESKVNPCAAYKQACNMRDFYRRKFAKKSEEVGYRFEVSLEVEYPFYDEF